MALRPADRHNGQPSTGAAQIRVLLVDEQALTRAGLRRILEEAGFVVCAEAQDADGAVEAAAQEQPAVCLLRLPMAGDAVAATRMIKSRLPNTIVVVVAGCDDAALLEVFCAGASGYLANDTRPERVSLVLNQLLDGEVVLPRSLVTLLTEEFREGRRDRRLALATQPGMQLTSREWDVLELLRQGGSTADIARTLFISKVTVRTHIASTLRKLGVPDRQAAIRLLGWR